MPEIGTSGSMSGDGKRALPNGCTYRAHPRLYRRDRWCDAAIRPVLGVNRKCSPHVWNDVNDPEQTSASYSLAG